MKQDNQEIVSKLGKISIFSGIFNKKNDLEKIAAIIKIEHFKAGSFIIVEGEYGDKMYVLNKGEVRIEKKTLSNDRFTVISLKDDMNVCFGEIALMDNDLRSASVLALKETECFVITKKDFEKLCESNPEIGYLIIREIAKSLSIRLRKATLDNVNLIAALLNDENGF
jgi:CRP/FNR family transcriptional regulator, cyclic AMP receptor protein